MNYIIVGSGAAGITAAKTLREFDSAAEIAVYTNELQAGLYVRKDMARHLANGTLDLDALYIHSPQDLLRMGIHVIYDPVLKVFSRYNQILVNHSIRKNYDRLLLATGATPRLPEVPGYHLLGVHQARSYEDFTFIDNWLPDVEASGVIVLGGGVLGMDMAYALAQRGVPATLITREAALGAPWLDAEQAAAAAARLADAGVTLRFNEQVTAFESDDGVVLDRVALSSGMAFRAQLVIACIGVYPNTDFLEESGVVIDEESGAIPVNAHLQTNLPNVYAAGGCALIDGQIAHNWALSVEQGRIAALNMAGQEVAWSAPVEAQTPLPLVLQADVVAQR